MINSDGVAHTAGNWVELQNKLDWLSKGVVIKSISVERYIECVRELMDAYEFMVVQRGK